MTELSSEFDVCLRHIQNMTPTQCENVERVYGLTVSGHVMHLRGSLPQSCKRVKVERGIRRIPKVGSIKPGKPLSFGKMWLDFVPPTKQGFQYAAVCASSKTAIAATSESERLRATLPQSCKRVKVERGIRRIPKVGSIKPGKPLSFGKMWLNFVPLTKQGFQYVGVAKTH